MLPLHQLSGIRDLHVFLISLFNMDIANITSCENHKIISAYLMALNTSSIFFTLCINYLLGSSFVSLLFLTLGYLLIACGEKHKENVETISNIERNAVVKKENTFVS